MGNIRHVQHLKIQEGDLLIDKIGNYQTIERVGGVPLAEPIPASQELLDIVREMGGDAHRFADPLDDALNESLRVVHNSDMTGAEKLASIQALQRMTNSDCTECGGHGWVATNQNYGNPAGEQEQCTECCGFGKKDA